MAQLSPAKLRAARLYFFIFNGINSSSFVILSGSFITLFAISLKANNATIGLLNSFGYLTFFFLPLGKWLVRYIPVAKIFGWAWLLRSLFMLPALFSPWLISLGLDSLGFLLVLVSVAGFNFFRGVGLIGNNPVLAHLADGGSPTHRADRGKFLSNVQIIGSITALLANFLIAMVIGESAPTWAFALAIGIAIILGATGSLIIIRLIPEPSTFEQMHSAGLIRTTASAFKEAPFRAYMQVLVLLSLVASVVRTFLPVYAHDVFKQGDGAVLAFSFVANFGSLLMGYITRLLVDKLGAKPLFVIFTGAAALAIVPLALIPESLGIFSYQLAPVLLLVFVNFFTSFGLSGQENAGQTYYFALVKPERTLELGVAYYIFFGLGGTIGSFAGGYLLDIASTNWTSLTDAYRILYGVTFVIAVIAIVHMRKLIKLGSASVRESIHTMLSLRDLRTFSMIGRLDQSIDPSEEMLLIHNLVSKKRKRLPLRVQDTLLEYLHSPKFDIRYEALMVLETMGNLDDRTIEALVNEVEKSPYTTAFIAARILGKVCDPRTFYDYAGRESRKKTARSRKNPIEESSPNNVSVRRSRVLPSLRNAAVAEDYLLKGTAMIALARLGDRESIGLIEEALIGSRIPRVRIAAAYALSIFLSRTSIPLFISCLRSERDPSFVSDELVLGCASILNMIPPFYRIYTAWMDDETEGMGMLGDLATLKAGKEGTDRRLCYDHACKAIFANPYNGAAMSRFILEIPGRAITPLAQGHERRVDRKAMSEEERMAMDIVLSQAALDPGLGYRGLHFLIAAYALLRI